MEKTFFEEMAHQLCTYNYTIDGQNVFYYIAFIEEKHKLVPVKGWAFYSNLMLALADYCSPFADPEKGEIPDYKEKVYYRVLEYYKKKMVELDEIESIPESKEEKTITENSSNPKLEVKDVALKYVYLSKAHGPAINKQNMDKLAKEHGFNSGDNLRNEFVAFKDENNRINFPRSGKRSANKHLERYDKILPLLKKENPTAYGFAQRDQKILLEKFDKRY